MPLQRGLVKKVVIADTFAIAVEAGFGAAATLNTAEAWFVAIGYTLQLYFDFPATATWQQASA